MKKLGFAKLIGAAVLAFALPMGAASAVTISIDSLAADWQNVQGGLDINFVNTDGITGNEEVRWGTLNNSGTGPNQSGYRFDGNAPPSFNVALDSQFDLGTFTHFNFPIDSGSSITGADLVLTIDLSIDANPLSEGPLTFVFKHNETSNSCSPQPNCARDIVTISNVASSDTFNVGGVEYTLTIVGFKVGGNVVDEFKTLEDQANEAVLVAKFTAREIPQVPEPAALLLIGAGLIGVGAAARAKKKAVEA